MASDMIYQNIYGEGNTCISLKWKGKCMHNLDLPTKSSVESLFYTNVTANFHYLNTTRVAMFWHIFFGKHTMQALEVKRCLESAGVSLENYRWWSPIVLLFS